MQAMEKFAFGKFWERKAKSYLIRLNVSGDGKITPNDYQLLADRYLKLSKVDELRGKQITRQLLALWDILFESSSTGGSITPDAWVTAIRCTSIFLMYRIVVEFMNLFFNLIDTNGDGVIQKEEFAIFLRAFRVENEADIAASFKAVDQDGDGKIDHNEFINVGIEFWMSNDESLPSKLLFGPLL